MNSTIAVFLIAAVVLNTIIYGGIFWVYRREQRPPEPARGAPDQYAPSSPAATRP